MKKSKVFVYLKPKNQTENFSGVIKTDKAGNIIEETKVPKEKKELDIKEVIEKTIKTEQNETQINHKQQTKIEKQEIKETDQPQTISYLSFFKILEPQQRVYQPLFVNYNSELLKNVQSEEISKIEPVVDIEKYDPLTIMEAALFMAVEGLTVEALAKLIKKDKYETQKLLEELKQRYEQKETAIEITNELKNKWIMRIKQQYAKPARQFASEVDISKHALKTLAFIAKNENITKRELFKKLGAQIYQDVAELEEKGFIKTIPLGRTSRIKLTEKFNQYFGI
ncbi:MAG: SMC-Scp complex subunit ScpB [Candidatus Anstonellaceae archaeon]